MGHPLNVLLVEDSENDALLAVRALRRAGYEPVFSRVQTADTMRAALDQRAWDVIVSDHSMPKFSELEALRVMQEKRVDLPFIVVSGDIQAHDVVIALKSGANEFLYKKDMANLGIAVQRAMKDVAAHKEHLRAVDALQKSEERYALAVRGSRDGLWDWDIQSHRAYYSPRFKEMLGATEHEFPGNIDALFTALHDEDREDLKQALNRHLQERVPFEKEVRLRVKGGAYRWFSIRGQALWNEDNEPTRMAGSLYDLTERKLAEERLREKLAIIERQQEAIRTLSTPIIEVWDGTLTMPVFGTIDSERAQYMMSVLLDVITRTRSRYAIVDLTGVDHIDKATANHVVNLIRAVQLLGARGIVVGIKPDVARTLVSIGVDLSDIITLANLREALVRCMQEPVH
jgi:PAS domain S-box-containing protein